MSREYTREIDLFDGLTRGNPPENGSAGIKGPGTECLCAGTASPLAQEL